MSDALRPLAGVSTLKLAVMAQQVRAQTDAVRRAEPLAVIGMGCRFPGGADSPEAFWRVLADGVDAVGEVPADRWEADAFYDADMSVPGHANTKWGGFLDRIDAFDAEYFRILSREAERMDPQHRLFLEVAVEALDDAGLPSERLRGSRTGVFVASYHNDYTHLQYGDRDAIDARTLTGALHSVLANRLSYLFDLRGPSLSLDTACSSGLVAVHLGCQSLRTGESDVAIVGGVSLMVSPELMIALSKGGFMAPDGRCKTFDASADGFSRGEGCGVVVLKRLADAIADGDRVLSVVRGSAVNQDGHSTLLAAPNGLAQQALLREAIANAQVEPQRIGFIETHGTGTKLGDPIEVEALAAVVGAPRADGSRCLLGSAKANLGHLEAAAGLVGVIKATLVMQHGVVPRQVHFQTLNPHISLAGTCLDVPAESRPWPRSAAPRLAGISSFGVGGTNAHVILEEAPLLSGDDEIADDGRAHLLPLSARSPDALRALASAWISSLGTTSATPAQLAYTAGARRTHHDHRLAVVGQTRAEWRAALETVIAGEPSPAAAIGRSPEQGDPRVAFVFGGQGPQWYAMGRELMVAEPVFRDAFMACDALMAPRTGWSLAAELATDEGTSRLDQTAVAQPALFAIQVALAALWRSWGITPSAVIGHSVGEIAALHVAGALALEEAVRVVCARGAIMQRATGTGRMAAAGLSAAEAAALVEPFGHRLSVGAINSPHGVTLSGEAAALDEALAMLDARGVSHRMLPVQYAFHSAQMAPFEQELAAVLADLVWRAPDVPVYSTVTGARADGVRFDGAYFGHNVRAAVKLAPALDALIGDGVDLFVEIGPHPVLATSIADCLNARGTECPVLASMRRGRAEQATMLQALAGAYAAGCAPSWESFTAATAPVSLPAYPWQRTRHWFVPSTRPGRETSAEKLRRHPLLGRRVRTAVAGTRVYERTWSPDDQGWIGDHRVFGRVALPAAAMLDAFGAAATDLLGAGVTVSELVLHRPMLLPEEGTSVAWQTIVTRRDDDGVTLSLHEAVTEDQWQLTATAVARRGDLSTPSSPDGGTTGVATSSVDVAGFYARLAELGVAFGPAFQVLADVRCSENAANGALVLPATVADADRHALHPVLLDGALQLCSVAAGGGDGGGPPASLLLPIGADRVTWLAAPATDRCRARAVVRREGSGASLTADVRIENEYGAPVAMLDGVRFAPAEAAAFAPPAAPDDWTYEISWERAARTAPPPRLGDERWLVFADRSGCAESLEQALLARNVSCRVVRAGDGLGQHSGDRWTVDPANPEQIAETCAGERWSAVVHLWALDCAPFGDDTVGGTDDLLTTGSLLHLVQALSAAPAPLRVVTRGAQVVTGAEPAAALRPRAAAAWGLASVVALEHPELNCRAIDLDAVASVDQGERLADELAAVGDPPARIALRGIDRWAPHLSRRSAPPRDATPVRLTIAAMGTLDGLAVRPMTSRAPRAGEVRVRVLASGLNFRDVLLTLGMYPGSDIPLGAECAGEIVETGAGVAPLRVGDLVFGFAPASLASEVTVPAAFLAPIPSSMGVEAAAALPVAYLTAHYALHTVAQLRRGERVLIHAGAGGVGMAAVQLALRAGAEVFATAGSPEKRARLTALGVHRALDSRSLSFAEQISEATGGAGVHVVVNSLSGDFIAASLGVTAAGGRFVELGKRDIMTPDDARRLRPDVRYEAFDLGAEAQRNHALLRPMYDDLLAALADGTIRPLPVTSFAFEEAAEAFRFMAQARHVGKIVIRAPVTAHGPRIGPEGSYWITGGLGALGLATARWLVSRGARHLALSGRSAPTSAATATIRELESAGARVVVLSTDAGDADQMRLALATIDATLPRLAGVVHAAGALDDGVLARQSWGRARAVMRGKADGAWHLHALLRERPLDFFVLYSAAGWLLGASGQGAYAAANAALDSLAMARHAAGLPALSVAWGRWNMGMAAGADAPWTARGLGAIDAAEAFPRLERLLQAPVARAVILPIDWTRFLAQLPPGVDRRFFGAVAPTERVRTPEPGRGALLARLRSLAPTRRRDALMEHLAERATQVLGLDRRTPIDSSRALKDVGLDSLMAVELRNALARSTGHPLPATLLFDYPTLDALAAHLVRVLELEGAPSAAAPSADGAASVAVSTLAAVSALSDDEAEALLLRELDAR